MRRQNPFVLKDKIGVKMRKVLWLIPFICSVAYSQNEAKRICYDVNEYTDKKTVGSVPVSLSEDRREYRHSQDVCGVRDRGEKWKNYAF